MDLIVLDELGPEAFGTKQHSIVQRLLRALRKKATEQLVAQEPIGNTPTAGPLPGAVHCSGYVGPHPPTAPHRASLASHLARPISRRRIDRCNGAIRVTSADDAIRGVKFGRRLTTRGLGQC